MLTDAACRKAVPGAKPVKLTDGGGLFLHLYPTGAKIWRWKYRWEGREKLLTIGRYPGISLANARASRDRARLLLSDGIDPSAAKRKQPTPQMSSFEQIARAWHANRAETLAPRYAAQILDRLQNDVFPAIGRRDIVSITAPQVLEVLRAIEARGALEMAHRVRMHMSDVFVWAIASGLAEDDPAAIVTKALQPRRKRLRPALLKVGALRKLLEVCEAIEGAYWATLLASRLLALTAARPGVIRLAERSEFEALDGPRPIWRISAAKMKLTRERKIDAAFEFVIPLSPQAVDVVKTAMNASSSPQWLFPAVRSRNKPISDSTLSGHYLDAGYRGRHVPHGWRASFSTIMNERAAIEDRERDRAIIDLMLAHVPEGVEAAYNRAAYMPRRRELANAWGNLIMRDRPGAASLVAVRTA